MAESLQENLEKKDIAPFDYSKVKIHDIWYRYYSYVFFDIDGTPQVRFSLNKFSILKVNPKSVWISTYHDWTYDRAKEEKALKLIKFSSKKKFAYPTIQEARNGLKYRSYSRLNHATLEYDRANAIVKNLENEECYEE